MCISLVLLLVVGGGVGPAERLCFAEELPEVLVFRNGERLTGISRGPLAGHWRWEMPYGEEILVPIDEIDHIEITSADVPTGNLELDADAVLNGDAMHDDGFPFPLTAGFSLVNAAEASHRVFLAALGVVDTAYQQSMEQFTDWTKRFEVGGRFLDGNRDQDFLDVNVQFEDDFRYGRASWDAGGQYGQTSGDRTDNRWFGNGTIDFAHESKWIVFTTSKNEYDEFENLAYRGTLSGGIGYRFYDEKRRRLITRVGPGVTHEIFNDPGRERTTPDLLLESELRWPLHDRVQVENKATVNPSVEDVTVVRIVSTSGLLFQLDNHERWMLKLGLRYEFNSNPNPGRREADYTSSVLLVYTRK